MTLIFPLNPTPSEAIRIQNEIKDIVRIEKLDKEIKTIARADVSFNKHEERIFAGIIVLSFPELKPVDYSVTESTSAFPYIPGLLSFREIPALLLAWKKLKIIPDLVMVDGQGICHPRRLGIASHLGVTLDVPTIGAAKSLLTGTYDEPELKRGNYSHIHDRKDKSDIIGAALVTKDKVKPMIVSPGHKIDLPQTIDIVLKTSLKHRLPEPTWLAHLLVNSFRKGGVSENFLASPSQDPLF